MDDERCNVHHLSSFRPSNSIVTFDHSDREFLRQAFTCLKTLIVFLN